MQIPSEPLDLQAQLSEDGYIHVWWNPPTHNLQTVEKYTVYWDSLVFGQQYDDVDSDVLSYTIKGVHSGTKYSVYVKAGNHYGYSTQSNTKEVMTHGECY